MLHTCVLLALLPRDKSLPAAKIAEYHRLPAAQTAKQLQTLSGAGVLRSSRGRSGGGYQLARPADKITVLDVVDAIEGREPMFRCTDLRHRGPCAAAATGHDTSSCAVTQTMRRAEAAWRDELAASTIADLVVGTLEQALPEVVSSSVVWLQKTMQ